MSRAPKLAAHSLRVVIIEDNAAIAALVGEAFRTAGHHTAGYAKSVEESLELISVCKFDVALLDVDLRGRSSGPVALKLHQRNLPFVVLTGSRGLMATAHVGAPILLKPFKMDELLEMALRYTQNRQRLRSLGA